MARKVKPVRTTIVSKQEDSECEVVNLQITIRKGELSLAYLLAQRGIISGIERRMESAVEGVVSAFMADAEQIVMQGQGVTSDSGGTRSS